MPPQESHNQPAKPEPTFDKASLERTLKENGIGINEFKASESVTMESPAEADGKESKFEKANAESAHVFSLSIDTADIPQSIIELDTYSADLKAIVKEANTPEKEIQEAWKQFQNATDALKQEMRRAQQNNKENPATEAAFRIRIGNRAEDVERSAKALGRFVNETAGETRITFAENESGYSLEALADIVPELYNNTVPTGVKKRLDRVEAILKKGADKTPEEKAELTDIKSALESIVLNRADQSQFEKTPQETSGIKQEEKASPKETAPMHEAPENKQSGQPDQERVQPDLKEKTPLTTAPETATAPRAETKKPPQEKQEETEFIYTVKTGTDTFRDALDKTAPDTLPVAVRKEVFAIIEETLAGLSPDDLKNIGISSGRMNALTEGDRIDFSIIFDDGNAALLDRIIQAAQHRQNPEAALTETNETEPEINEEKITEEAPPSNMVDDGKNEPKPPVVKDAPTDEIEEEPDADNTEEIAPEIPQDTQVQEQKESDVAEVPEEPPLEEIQRPENTEQKPSEPEHRERNESADPRTQKLSKKLTQYIGKKGFLGFGRKPGIDTVTWQYTKDENIGEVTTSTAQRFSCPEDEFAGLQNLIQEMERVAEPREDETLKTFLLRGIEAAEHAKAEK